MSLILSGTDGLSDVDGTAATPAIRGTDANTGIFFPAADTIAFSEGGAEIARFDSSGNFGVGTSSPTAKLDAFQSSVGTYFLGGGGDNKVRQLAIKSSTTTNSGDTHTFDAQSGTGILAFAITGAEKARIDTSGNLGIGTTSPAKKLQINSSDTTDGIRLYCSDAGGENLSIVWQSAYGPNTITGDIKSNASGTGGNFILRTANTSAVLTEALRVDNAQNLLVGTTTKNNDGKISISASSALNQGMTIKETSATNDIYYILFTNSAGATAGRIEHTGATTVNYTSGSDVRLKTNIVDAGSAKEKIEAIKIREFDWITGEHQKFGVIAQELIEVAPEAVCAGRTENDHWGVDYSKLVPSLIKYVQEQQALITQLTARITALEEA